MHRDGNLKCRFHRLVRINTHICVSFHIIKSCWDFQRDQSTTDGTILLIRITKNLLPQKENFITSGRYQETGLLQLRLIKTGFGNVSVKEGLLIAVGFLDQFSGLIGK